MSITWRDPLIHSGVTQLAIVPLWLVFGWKAVIVVAIFWIGWEMGQKQDPARPILSRLRPFDIKNHPQSFAEWTAPTLASIPATAALAMIFGG